MDEHSIGQGEVRDGVAGLHKKQHLAGLELLYRWRWFLIINVLAASILAAGVSLILPKSYKAIATVLPPKQQDFLGSLGSVASSLSRSLPGASRLGLGQRPASYNYFALLNSRRSLDTVIRRFDLLDVYKIRDSSMEKAAKELSRNVSFEEQTDEYISIEVTDESPQRAAAMANAFVEILNTMSGELSKLEGRNNREFLERRVAQSRVDLKNAEESLKSYQQVSKTVITTEQTAALTGMASLYAMRARKEVELGVLRQSLQRDDPSLKTLSLEINEINRQLAELPEIGIESLRRYREVLIQQQILEFLLPMYEQARISEVKDLPVVLVLDRASTPEKRSSPQRTLIVMVTFFLALFTSVLLVFLLEWLRREEPSGPVGSALERVARKTAALYRVEFSSAFGHASGTSR